MKQDNNYMHIFCRLNSRLEISELCFWGFFYVCLDGLPMVMELTFVYPKKNISPNNGHTCIIAGKLSESYGLVNRLQLYF